MIIEALKAKAIKDSRGDKTVEVSIKTNIGKFSASAPNGKSKGKHEAKSYKKSLEQDIEALEKISEYFSDQHLEKFDDLKHIESVTKGHIGANTLFALESAALKAIAKESKKEIWQIINPNAKIIPRLVGNCIGGGLHSELINNRRPDFQEFLLVPKDNSMIKNSEKTHKAKEDTKLLLKTRDQNFKEKTNDENAWMTSLGEKEILEILETTKIPLGLDVAASGFYKRKKYHYKNPPIDRAPEEQLMFLNNLIKNFKIFYIEDPFEEEDFESFKKLLEKNPKCLIVGDDLTVTNYKRLEKAIEVKAINALIMKPNQNGSLIEMKRIVELANKNNIKMIFSHRSGETTESILADLAFGFGADFIKCGITGKEREAKINRMIEIEKSLK
jgi:enolase